jgi:peptidyl-prolyl cis-trans isomerase SurA
MDFIINRGVAIAVKTSLTLIFCLFGYTLLAQESIDKIIAVVGRNRIILQSDLNIQMMQLKQQKPDLTKEDTCMALESMVRQKIMLEQAARDSVSVTDEDVDGQLENRLRYFIQMYGSKEKLEQAAGKTIYQMKDEYREGIKETMIAEKMQAQILEHVKITPKEVDAFYKKLPVDSLPFFPASVEVGQIVIDPIVSDVMNDYAKQKLEGIRAEIIEGKKTFEQAATLYSDDPGSRDNGGRYDGVARNGPWASEFLAATFKLQNDEISPIVKTKFGYHIIQMISRRGDEADVRHILVKPNTTSADYNKAMARLDSVRNLLVQGKLTFPEAVGKFSTDEAAKRTGGMVSDPQTGATELDMTRLDPGMVLVLDSLQEGQYSKPHIFVTETQEKSCRIIYLRSRTAPHKANLKDDYGRIQEVALTQKKALRMQSWIKEKIPTFYIKLDQDYNTCPVLGEWMKAGAQ